MHIDAFKKMLNLLIKISLGFEESAFFFQNV